MKRKSLREKEFSIKVKREAWDRSQGFCEFCGDAIDETSCQYHHRDPKFSGGEDSIDNCIVLCNDCHTSTLGYMIFHGKNAAPKNMFTGGRSESKLRRMAYYARMNAIKRLAKLLPVTYDLTKLEKNDDNNS